MNYKLFFLKDKITIRFFIIHCFTEFFLNFFFFFVVKIYLDGYIFLNLNFNIISFYLLKIKPK